MFLRLCGESAIHTAELYRSQYQGVDRSSSQCVSDRCQERAVHAAELYRHLYQDVDRSSTSPCEDRQEVV